MFSMYKSIQYFNEECAQKFDLLEDEFIRNPSDLASYIYRLTEELHKIGIRMIQETLEDMDKMLNDSIIRKKRWVVDRHEQKQLITSLGTVRFDKTLFKERQTGKREYLLDRLIQMESHERMSEDAVAELLKEAVQTSYRRGGEEINNIDNVTKQTVMNKIHNLKFPKDKVVLEDKKYVKKLYIDADEDHLSLQYQKIKGDLVSGRYGRKNNSIIAKIVYVYEGIEEESPGSKRHKLINPHYFCSTSDDKENSVFWQEIYEWIDHHYDLGRIEKIYLNGDGGAWMKAGKDFVDGVITTMDEFHLQKYLTMMTNHLKDSQGDAITEIREILRHKGKKEFKDYCTYLESYLKKWDEDGYKRISKGRKYILDNWMEAKIRIGYRKALPGCSAEGHVSHVLSARMSSRPMGWSRIGAAKMCQLRAYYYNGGNMLELVKMQKQELPKAAGEEWTFYTPYEIKQSERNRHYMLGKYMESMSASIDKGMKKHIWLSTHITGL